MKEMLNQLEIRENRFWGLAALYPVVLLFALVCYWEKLSKDERAQALSVLILMLLITVCSCIPLVGTIAAIVLLVFYVIAVVKFFKGDIGYKIFIARAIADKFVK